MGDQDIQEETPAQVIASKKDKAQVEEDDWLQSLMGGSLGVNDSEGDEEANPTTPTACTVVAQTVGTSRAQETVAVAVEEKQMQAAEELEPGQKVKLRGLVTQI